MFAICKIQGKQYQVEVGRSILVDRITQEIGSKISYDTVLSLHDEEKVKWGSPYVASTKVEVEIEAHVRGKKLRVFKRRKRKNSKNLKGYRHDFTQLKIKKIG